MGDGGRNTDAKYIIFLSHFRGEKITYPKIATGNLQEGVIEYGSRVRREDKTTRRIYGDSKAGIAFFDGGTTQTEA